jgi:hypothetical protein
VSTTDATSLEAVQSLDEAWPAGVVAGVAGAAAMAVLLTAVAPPVIYGAIPGLYGLSGPVAGWTVHLTHGGAFGVLFAALTLGAVSRRGVLAIGFGFGVVLWFVGAGAIMPIWLQSVGFPGAGGLSLPNLEPVTLVGHLVWGGVTGALFPALVARLG